MLSFFFRHGLVVTINSTDQEAAQARAFEIAAERYQDAGYAEDPTLSGVGAFPKDGVVVTWNRNDPPTQAEINIASTLGAAAQLGDHERVSDALQVKTYSGETIVIGKPSSPNHPAAKLFAMWKSWTEAQAEAVAGESHWKAVLNAATSALNGRINRRDYATDVRAV